MRDLTKTELDLLRLVSNALFDTPIDCSNIDWIEIEKEATSQAVLMLAIYKHFKEVDIPDKKQKLGLMTSNNLKVISDHIFINNLIQSNNIPFVFMKGCASAYYYPNPIYRSMGDIDFLVNKNMLSTAGEILANAGFCFNGDEHNAHKVYKKDDSVVEMHWTLSGIPSDKNRECVEKHFNGIIETAITINVDGCNIVVPDAFHHCLVLLIHTAGHLINTGIGLRHLCDWATFVDVEDVSKWKIELEECGLWRFSQLLTQLSVKYLGLPEKAWAMENVDDELLNEMICDIFAGGNFGNKDDQRINQAKLMTDNYSSSVGDNNMIKGLVNSINFKAKLAIPLVNKIKILLPISWIYVLIRHFIRIIFGKRPKINPKEMIKGANQRRDIYKEFKLFETK